ncbi:TPA: peptidoglycan-binding protein, partial [bacterium UBP9_UBA11836]|nr:peptidoglycan-binding protein [bacterium UBP9_UBA11836]
VKSGENLYTIAKNYGLAIEHLAFANGRDPNNINVAPGTSLLIPGRRVLPSNPPD